MPVWLTWLGTRLAHWIVYMLLTILVFWSVYVTVIKPHIKPTPTEMQKATTIYNNNYNCKALIGWGCGKCS